MKFKRTGAGSRNSQNVLKWFCQCFPSWHEVLVYGVATRRFLVCHFPFLKIEKKKNSPFFITRKYLFHCSPRFTGNTLGVFKHPTRLFRSQILFFVISRIPQISVHFPLVSTIGEACFPEVRVLCHVSFQQVSMLFMGFCVLKHAYSSEEHVVCYLRKQSFPQENSITDIFSSINNWLGDLTKIIYEFHLIIILEWPMFKFPWWKFWGASFHHAKN